MPKAASTGDHEAATRFLTARELCWDLAREHTSAIEENGKRNEAREHYEEIAGQLCRCPPKPRSALQRVMTQKKVDEIMNSRQEEEHWKADLVSVFHNQGYSLERRRAAHQELQEFRQEWQERERRQHSELVELSLAPGYYRPKSRRLVVRLKREGRERFFFRLDSTIGRYLKAKVEGAW